jgi:hypothetical protein
MSADCRIVGRFFVRTRTPAGGIASKELKQKLKNVKSKKRPARRAIILKSASWYANAALSIGISAKAEPRTH